MNTLEPDYTRRVDAGRAASASKARVRGARRRRRATWGRTATHLVRKRNINQPPPGPGADCDGGRSRATATSCSSSPTRPRHYNALQLRARAAHATRSVVARGLHVVQVDGRHVGVPAERRATTTRRRTARPRRAERGLSDFDVRHRLVARGRLGDARRATGAWARDWQVSAVFAAQSGRPFTPRVGFDNSNTATSAATFAYDRPNEVDRRRRRRDAVSYDGRVFVDRAAVHVRQRRPQQPDRARVRARSTWRSRRAFRWARRAALEARLEIYNALNRANLGLPDSFVDRPTFGQSLSASPARQAQLVVRFYF